MEITQKNLNRFLFFKLPSAWWCGVRVKKITQSICEVTVTHKWINQNPFRSMYFAVQAMAAELSTGALVMKGIKESEEKISMLVAQNKASFSKKATGKITFSCNDDKKILEAIKNTIATGEGQTFWLESQGVNGSGVVVSNFEFEWTIKLKK
ncbi:DUF4442 domain-containing protein [Aquimarina agarilytica]|uniref:DUF4442 domain-containing protein n=1 Tax=Aquimarina agarilytica TaxID=1087449 RepID=UPI000288053C|nr:DUF4442 domain-containing protein [Aquimarina agarilytica]